MNSSSGIINSGKRAKKTGNRLEKFVEQALKDSGYNEFWDYKKQVFANRKTLGGRQYAKQIVVGTTIYNTERKCDFLVINRAKFPEDLIIECKWQQVGGSVDEKYPFLLYNIFKTGVPTIVLLDGGGCKPAARQWLKAQANPMRSLIAVWDMAEFQKEVNNGFFE